MTTPMWVVAILMVYAGVQPYEMPLPGEPAAPVAGTGGRDARVEWLERELRRARRQAGDDSQKGKELEAAMGQHGQRTRAWVDSVPDQGALATALCIVGMFAVFGTSSFVRFAATLAGSAAAGLAVAAFANRYSGHPAGAFWLDSAAELAGGAGRPVEYVLWFLVAVCGVARWAIGFECGWYMMADEISVGRDGAVTVLQKPLLHGQPSAPVGSQV